MQNPLQGRQAKAISVAVAIILVAALVYGIRSSLVPKIGNADEGEFLSIDASDRELDGTPSLALTFTLPLDARKSYDKYIQVFEMPGPPPRPAEQRPFGFQPEDASDKGGTIVSTKPEDTNPQGGSVVSGAWTVGDNPRLLFFQHIKPETRYVVLVHSGVEARNGS